MHIHMYVHTCITSNYSISSYICTQTGAVKLNSVFVLDNKVLLPNGDNIYGYVVGDNGYVGRIQDNELEQIDFSSASQLR